MEIVEKIISYLKETYSPEAIIIYGSFADGSANENSDFDALVISDRDKTHDSSVIDGTILDVFIYPSNTFLSAYNPEEFVQVFDGKIVLDEKGVAHSLQKQVLSYIEHTQKKTTDEIQQEVSWCEKMVLRTERNDAEGYYRWHWVLLDSLEIYCDIQGFRYFGPKKALRLMKKADKEAFRIYSEALKFFEREHLSEWISYLILLSNNTPRKADHPENL